jgi:glycosyltransferase involved in cell wall biosynthesis
VRIQLGSLFTIYCNDTLVSHTFFSLNQFMSGANLSIRMVVPNCEQSLRRANLVEAIPSYLKPFCYLLSSGPRIIAEAHFLSEIDNFDAVYLFPGPSLNLFRKIRRRRKPIFVERINCHTAEAKRILDEAYSRLGVSPQHGISRATISRENEELEMSDFIFCPSPEVERSFSGSGVPTRKLILSSYGWSPSRFPNIGSRKSLREQQGRPIEVLFVGHLSVRKGTHLLLHAWAKAGIDGRLVLCGKMEPTIAKTCAQILSRSDVVWREFDPKIADAYDSASIFACPSLEEGSPLVTYEAMAHGLPILVSPMGAGGVVRNDVDGIIIPPYDEDAWIDALQRLAGNADLRAALGESARQQASEFTWEKVAGRRANVILDRLNLTILKNVC